MLLAKSGSNKKAKKPYNFEAAFDKIVISPKGKGSVEGLNKLEPVKIK